MLGKKPSADLVCESINIYIPPGLMELNNVRAFIGSEVVVAVVLWVAIENATHCKKLIVKVPRAHTHLLLADRVTVG